MLTGEMLTPLSKNRTNTHKILFWHGKFVNIDIDVEDRRTLEEFLIAVGHCIRFE